MTPLIFPVYTIKKGLLLTFFRFCSNPFLYQEYESLKLFSFSFFFCRCAGFNKLEEAHFCSITLAAAEFDDAGVTAVAFSIVGSDFSKEFADCFNIAETGDCKTAMMQSTAFCHGNKTFSKNSCFFGFDNGGFDFTVFDQSADHIGEQSSAM